MGVYIKDLKKPKDCYECPIAKSYLDCLMEKKYVCPIGHTDDCPLIEIVECKDCKYWTDDMSGNMWCEHAIGGLTEPTDFCSYGDRIDEYEKEYRELGLYELRELRKGERRADDTDNK